MSAGPLIVHGASVEDSFVIDPEEQAIYATGAARRTRRVCFHEHNTIGTASDSNFATAGSQSTIKSWDVTGANNGGWNSRPVIIEDWMDVTSDISVIIPIQWTTGGFSANAVFRASISIARVGSTAITNSNLTSVTVVRPGGAGQITQTTVGSIPAGTLQEGDIVTVAVERLGTDGADTYGGTTRLARMGWMLVTETKK